MSWEGSKGMVLLPRSDSHICEFILSNITPVGCSSIKWKKSDLSVYYKDLEKNILIQINCSLKIDFICLANYQNCFFQQWSRFNYLMLISIFYFYKDEKSMFYWDAITHNINLDLFRIPYLLEI